MIETILPIVNAATIVPIPNPSKYQSIRHVKSPVVARHKTSNMILTLAYGLSMISDNSLGNKSVGMIGSWHLFSKAIPILNKK